MGDAKSEDDIRADERRRMARYEREQADAADRVAAEYEAEIAWRADFVEEAIRANERAKVRRRFADLCEGEGPSLAAQLNEAKAEVGRLRERLGPLASAVVVTPTEWNEMGERAETAETERDSLVAQLAALRAAVETARARWAQLRTTMAFPAPAELDAVLADTSAAAAAHDEAIAEHVRRVCAETVRNGERIEDLDMARVLDAATVVRNAKEGSHG